MITHKDVLRVLKTPMTAARVCAMFPDETLRVGLYLTQLVNAGQVKTNRSQSLMLNVPKPIYKLVEKQK